MLAKPDGTVIFGSESPLGNGMRRVMEPESVAEVARTQMPAVGPMTTGPRGNIGFTVRVPVMRGAEVRYVLTAIVSIDAIVEVIQQQQVPSDSVISVFDSKMKRVARSREHGRYLGTAPTPSLQALLDGLGNNNETFGITTTLEGEEAYTAVSRIQGTGWTIAMGAPTQIAQAALWRTAALYSAGLILSLGLGSLAFFFVSRSITTRASALRKSAVALGLGQPQPPLTRGLPDFDAVSEALWEAGQLHAKAQKERDSLLRSETQARALAEHTQGRLQLLLNATSSLSQSLDEASTLSAIASAVVPTMADICRVDLLNAEGELERKLTFHRDPTKVAAIEQVVHSGKVMPTTTGTLPWVIATGREHVQYFDPADTAAIEDPVFRKFIEVTGMQAVCVVPLFARGRTIGAMAAIQAGSGRTFDGDEVTLLCELGRRAALALDNVRLYTECNSALDKAQAASKTKDDFLAMLGHELRNPLAPILTALELLKRRDVNAYAREHQIIERQAKHLAHLLDDLLDVSRVVSGKIQLQRETLDLRSVVSRALEVTQPLFDRRAPLVVKGLDAPVHVQGDLLRLAQVVGNLLNNAAKFSEPDQPVIIQLQHRSGCAILTVEDHGVGIPEELLPHVFDRFVQSAQTLQRSKGGLGLGLAIARSIIDLHGGTIEATHRGEGPGTRITISLPLAPVAPQENLPPTHREDGSRSLRVFVVDDNIDAANMLASLLTHAGHQVGTAFDAEACLQTVEAFAPDVCILDIGLPGMDGYELARRLRTGPATRWIHLIALTGYGQHSDREMALNAGFDDHMTKPATLQVVEIALSKTRPIRIQSNIQ